MTRSTPSRQMELNRVLFSKEIRNSILFSQEPQNEINDSKNNSDLDDDISVIEESDHKESDTNEIKSEKPVLRKRAKKSTATKI